MRESRSRVALVALGLAIVAVAGCAPVVTSQRVQATFGASFRRLYVLQQSELGRDRIRHFYSTASCAKGSPHTPQTGAGDNWVCVEQWQQYDGYVATASYDVTVRTDGCLDAIGPANVVGGPQLVGPSGRSIVNPLAEFDACFQS